MSKFIKHLLWVSSRCSLDMEPFSPRQVGLYAIMHLHSSDRAAYFEGKFCLSAVSMEEDPYGRSTLKLFNPVHNKSIE